MILEKSGSVRLKDKVREILLSKDFRNENEFKNLSPKLVLSALFSFYFDKDKVLRWRAIEATGQIVAGMADKNMESARIVMRRLMWTLNDESGGIGWGSPEAMGEIMARHPRLADEYHRILISYMMEDGNYLEHEVLQRGVLWAVARLSLARPDIGIKAKGLVGHYLTSGDREVRGLSALLAGIVGEKDLIHRLDELTKDESLIEIYELTDFKKISVSSLAREAISRITEDRASP